MAEATTIDKLMSWKFRGGSIGRPPSKLFDAINKPSEEKLSLKNWVLVKV